MPLPYRVTKELQLPDSIFSGDDLAFILVQGGRYGGHWVMSAAAPEKDGLGDELGSVQTTMPHEDPAMAFDTAYIWVNDAAVRAGYRVAGSDDINHERPADERPYFMAGRFIIDRRKRSTNR